MTNPSGSESLIVFFDVSRTREELPEPVRLRVAHDVLLQLVDDYALPLGARTATSRLQLSNVRVDEEGTARVVGTGDSSGVQVLIWEILAGRVAPASGPVPRVHDVVDEIHPDVDEVAARALGGRFATIEELLEAFDEAAHDRLAVRDDVLRALGAKPALEPAMAAPPPPPAALAEPVAELAPAAATVEAAPVDEVPQPIEAQPSFDAWEIPPSVSAGRPGLVPPPPVATDADAAAPQGQGAEPVPAAEAASVSIEPVPPSVPAIIRESGTRFSPTQTGFPGSLTPPDPSHAVVLFIGPAADDMNLCTAIEESGYRVEHCPDPARGFELAQSLDPSCIVVDCDHSGDDGTAFVRRLRVEGSSAASIPLAFLAQSSAERSNLAGFLVGADVCVTKPFRVHDAVIQIGALVRMSQRLRTAQEWLKSRPVQKAFEGNLEHISIATVLSVLEMERRTGVFAVTSKNRRAEIDFVAGYAVRGIALGIRVSALGALQKMLEWKRGRFSFTPLPPRDPPPNTPRIGELLLEALRQRDEADAGVQDTRRSAR